MIIHFWQLPKKRNYIIIKNGLRNKILDILNRKKYPWIIKEKIRNGKISIEKIKELSKKENLSLVEIEKHLIWIGGNNSKGLSNPKFPLNFSSREGVRFIAAIVNDGTLTKEGENSRGRMMYDNFDESLRNSVLKDYFTIFGGKTNEVAFRNSENKKYFEFSSVTRDIIELILKDKGPKCESDLKVPDFITKDKNLLCGWIEQTIADEGEVKYYPNDYRRAIIWRRSLDVTDLFDKKIKKDISLRKLPKDMQILLDKRRCNITTTEEKMLKVLGIEYRLYNLGVYPTVKEKIRTRWQISITKRENLLKLRSLIKIPSKPKDTKLTLITNEFVRFKEPLKIKETIINLGRNKESFTSIDLKKEMNYKETNTAIKWLKIAEKERIIKKIKESSYGHGAYRKPAEYKLTLNK